MCVVLQAIWASEEENRSWQPRPCRFSPNAFTSMSNRTDGDASSKQQRQVTVNADNGLCETTGIKIRTHVLHKCLRWVYCYVVSIVLSVHNQSCIAYMQGASIAQWQCAGLLVSGSSNKSFTTGLIHNKNIYHHPMFSPAQ